MLYRSGTVPSGEEAWPQRKEEEVIVSHSGCSTCIVGRWDEAYCSRDSCVCVCVCTCVCKSYTGTYFHSRQIFAIFAIESLTTKFEKLSCTVSLTDFAGSTKLSMYTGT